MQTKSKDTIINLGRGIGFRIMNSVKNAKSSVKIISPYLSPDYIKELLNLHNKGVKITLITCDNIETNNWSEFKVSDIIKRKKFQTIKLYNLKNTLIFQL